MPDLKYWVALNLLSSIGPVLARRLVSVFGDPENVFHMDPHELMKMGSIGEERARQITGFRDWDRVEREIEAVHRSGVRLVTIRDEDYPDGLRQIDDAPIMLYMKGEIRDSDKYAIAMVGSRTPTYYGVQVAERISHDLAERGLTIVSGMARGIDSVSHRGALKAKGRTIAVLGSGIDVPYPRENRGLMDEIASSGAVISEFPMGTLPDKGNFPRRNRLISALSLGVIVVEATGNSGSLITANYALDQGKEVFAVPGNITSKRSKGTNDLIKKGARLIEGADDVIEELRPQLAGIIREHGPGVQGLMPQVTEEEEAILRHLGCEPRHIDDIVRESRLSINKALSLLLALELKGIVKQMDGKNFIINIGLD
jgi:DNA processing protein